MKLLGIAFLVGLGGYIVGTAAGMLLVQVFSTNTYDRDLEALMTSFFFFGPLGAVLGFTGALLVQLSKRGRG